MSSIRFALNHMCAPSMTLESFFAAAKELGIDNVEIRNDLAGNAILDGTPARAVRELAVRQGLTITSINALQRFNEWNDERAGEAAELIDYARDCGAKALVLVPVNDGSGREPDVRRANLRKALSALKPMLEAAGIVGLVEPLGFEICSLRLKSEAADAIEELGATSTFRLVHDTFHHHLAGEAATFPQLTGLVHISGVSDPDVSVADMRDPHRVLVDAEDRLDNVGQLRSLLSAGYAGPASFEPFASAVHALKEPIGALKESMAYIKGQL
ncbi:TIM barrel protein [Rhizobium lusitanum]|uniref:2-keto-myo-inositol isomerase n=1 Tax=Rhizobium lusitanum TaxID=293958 RepID=A0A7X0MD04_9HYPH|nr:TIM barrel protein [Rhizobium lusitanum]MBB6484465.1 2-keto-myo-inositol isomerase [Rhizobium lusitanum]